MDNNTLIGLLTLICLVGGGALAVVWSKVSGLAKEFADERVNSAKAFITTPELDRRLLQAVTPIEQSLTRIESQNKQIFDLLTHKALQ